MTDLLDPTNGAKVRPDHQTKMAFAALYSFSMAVVLFLAAAVWSMWGSVNGMAAMQESQLRDNKRSEERDKELKSELRDLRTDVKHLAEQINNKGD